MPDDDTRHPAGRGLRAKHKLATSIALRAAALELMTEHGYEATSTDDIARAAGVSPRTFFNYFPTKESVVALPDELLAGVVAEILRSRPADEDTEASLTAAAMATVAGLARLASTAGVDDAQSMTLATLRLMFRERPLRQIFFERRAVAEERVWEVLLERGVDPDDVAARAAVARVVALTYLGLRLWVEGDAAEPLHDVVARCLAAAS
jgi:AcrR family transcriptional regulator